MPSFFPEPAFGWAFYAIILGFLAVASYTDLRWAKIPKPLTLSMLGVGALVNVLRGAWLGAVLSESPEGPGAWLLGPTPGLGALDGFLFAFSGFLLSFGCFFALYILGAVAGGDVKLFAAIGAWMGPRYFFPLFLGTGVFLAIGTVWAMARKLLRKGMTRTLSDVSHTTAKTVKNKHGAKKSSGPRLREGVMTYSLSVALSAAILIPWLFARDLQLVPPQPQPPEQAAAQPQ